MNDLSAFEDFCDLADENARQWNTLTGENGPPLWRRILELLNNPGAVIAGGAVRDYLLGVEPKDIDIFVPSSNFLPPPIFDSIYGRDERAEEYEAINSIDIVMRGRIAGITVDLIGMSGFETAAELAQTFDFGISRSWFDGHHVCDTVEAQRDRESRTVTLLLTDRLERSRKRFERFNERMGGGWTLVEPDAG